MGVDALSYVGNMLAECQTDRRPSTYHPAQRVARPACPAQWLSGPRRLLRIRCRSSQDTCRSLKGSARGQRLGSCLGPGPG